MDPAIRQYGGADSGAAGQVCKFERRDSGRSRPRPGLGLASCRQLEATCRPRFDSRRAELAFCGNPPRPAHLYVPHSKGSLLNPDFRDRREVTISTETLANLVDGTLLDFAEDDGLHRLNLRNTAGQRENR